LVLARTLKIIGRTLLTKTQLVRAIERRQTARAKVAPYRYTPMYPKPAARRAPGSGVTTRRSGSISPARKSALLARPRSSRPESGGTPCSLGLRSPGEDHPLAEPSFAPEKRDVLPDRYGETRLVAQARDPRWLHAYWELAEADERRAVGGRTVLRIYELTTARFSSKTIRRWDDITPTPEARDWFIEVGRPASWWCLELGVAGPGGFVPLVRSNLVETPADRPSDEYEADWPRLADALAAQMAGQVSSSRAALS